MNLDTSTSWEETKREIEQVQNKALYSLLPEVIQSIVYSKSASELEQIRKTRSEIKEEFENFRDEVQSLESETQDLIQSSRSRGDPLPEEAMEKLSDLQNTVIKTKNLLSNEAKYLTKAEQSKLKDLQNDLRDIESYVTTKQKFDSQIDELEDWINEISTEINSELDTEQIISEEDKSQFLRSLSNISGSVESTKEEIDLGVLTEADINRIEDIEDNVKLLRDRISQHNNRIVGQQTEGTLTEASETVRRLADVLEGPRKSGSRLDLSEDKYLSEIESMLEKTDNLLSDSEKTKYIDSDTVNEISSLRNHLIEQKEFIQTKAKFDRCIEDITDEISDLHDEISSRDDYLTTRCHRAFDIQCEKLRETLDEFEEDIRTDILASSDREKIDHTRSRVDELQTRIAKYNDEWVEEMKEKYADELNSYFDDPDAQHTDQQLHAIFRNDNFNRVNAAAGTGKTTTFGRRVHFILSEYEKVKPSDILAITFTRNGRREMQKELEDTFGISGVDVRTLNSYAKSVAEDQYPNLKLVLNEAKFTEITDLWREVRSLSSMQDTYEEFMSAWKEEEYEPEDKTTVDGEYKSISGNGTTILGEELPNDNYPEERLAHQAIAKWLAKYEIEYDYKCHADWASSSTGSYILDFRVHDPDRDRYIYIEYSPTQKLRRKRPHYNNPDYENPDTIRRLFDEGSDSSSIDREVLVIEGEQIIDESEDESDDEKNWSKFKADIQKKLEEDINGRFDFGRDTPHEDGSEELKRYVYDKYILERKIVENLEEFIQQVRVREWSPEKTKQKVEKFFEKQEQEQEQEQDNGSRVSEDNEKQSQDNSRYQHPKQGVNDREGMREFCELAIEVYRGFSEKFDNKNKTDFHGSLELTRDLLQEQEVNDELTYPYVFVDEMQDLNPVQFDIVKYLARQKSDTRVFGVGDDWQSIYGFRGARPDLFINFGEELEAGQYSCDSIDIDTEDDMDKNYLSGDEAFTDTKLENNHRCPEHIVDVSNQVIKNNEVRTEKNPSGSSSSNSNSNSDSRDNNDDDKIRVHHIGCDTYEDKLNNSMARKVQELVENSRFDPGQTQILLRQKEGDPKFYSKLSERLSDRVDIRTAHDAKGSQAEHVIIPKVIEAGGYPNIRADEWLEPVKQPPEIYEQEDADYQMEEERRLFYVALTRSEERLDVLTVEGSESVFIDELPEDRCLHKHPMDKSELTQIRDGDEVRKTVKGKVRYIQTDNYATFNWESGGIVDIHIGDATERQKMMIEQGNENGIPLEIENCKLEFTDPTGKNWSEESERLRLKIDSATSVEPSSP